MEYALINAGRVENVIVADAKFIGSIGADWDHIEPLDTVQEQSLGVGIGWEWDGTRFIAPSAQEQQPAAGQRRVSVLAFRRRFTPAERAAIEWAAVDRPEQTDAQRLLAAALRATLADQAAATYIDLADADTVAGVQTLEALGLLATGRAAEILGAPIQPGELP